MICDAYGYITPGPAVGDARVGYTARSAHAALRARNIFDKHHHPGGLNEAVAPGDDRTVMLAMGYPY